jgi:hypothetical protein
MIPPQSAFGSSPLSPDIPHQFPLPGAFAPLGPIPDLQTLSLDARSLFEHYARKVGVPLSDYTFAINLLWLPAGSGRFALIDDCFCLFCLDEDGLSMPLPPLGTGERQPAALAECLRLMDEYNSSPALSTVEFVYRDFLNVAGIAGSDGEPWLIERSLPDYIYRTADLIELRGNAYKSKRSEINQFRRTHPNHRLERLGRQHFDGIRDLYDTWLRNRIAYLPSEAIGAFYDTVEQERVAVERALAHYDTLALEGLCLFIDDRLEGFTFGERITADVGNVLVEKTNFAISGSAQYLFREFAKTFSDCTYLNVGDDLGLENLRRVKMSYRPALFGEKVTLRRNPAGS